MKTSVALLCCFCLPIMTLFAATYYVAEDSPSPTAPYASWVTAATNIQDALGYADDNDTVLVSMGSII